MSRAHRMILMGAVATAPAWLFDRLYRIAPYGGALRDWVDGLPGQQAGRRVLELGCGPGDLTRYLAERGCLATGGDKSPAMLRTARRPDSRARFIACDALATGLDGGRFDAVISASLLNAVGRPGDLVGEMARLTRPGGVVSVFFPSPAFDAACAAGVVKRAGLTGFARAGIELWAEMARKFDPAEAEALMRAAGLDAPTEARFLGGGVVSMSALKPG